jgi:hypothetical protein
VETGQAVIDATTQVEILQNLSEKLRACYVFPDSAENICIHLQQHLEDGDYNDIREGEYLALALTIDMQAVAHDEHLWLRWHAERLPDEADELRFNQAWQDVQRLKARQDNYGIHKVEWLPGNVGYVDIRYFHRAEWGTETLTAAMRFLANAQALVIDLRQCQGGYPDMVALVSSYLFGSEPVHLGSIYWRDEERTQEYWTTPEAIEVHFVDQPVYVLISKTTFSGGEAFAYNLQARRRATLIGEQTGGGAHPGASYRIHPHFEAFIPIGRSINPLTGTDWEGCGVAPDIPVPAEQALERAYRMALEDMEK